MIHGLLLFCNYVFIIMHKGVFGIKLHCWMCVVWQYNKILYKYGIVVGKQ
jgi:hypothetical protein